MPYAAYCYLRDMYRTSDFTQWKENSVFDKNTIRELCSVGGKAYPEISFLYFLQYVLHTQFKGVSDYARKNGIVLKGDLPIGVNRTSVEAWMEPKYFNMNGQAGAPPDDFSVNGQNWGFPTYNWDMMEKDNFSWWKKRFRKLEDYFDSFRIDHILGFSVSGKYRRSMFRDFAGILTLLCRLPRTKSNSMAWISMKRA